MTTRKCVIYTAPNREELLFRHVGVFGSRGLRKGAYSN